MPTQEQRETVEKLTALLVSQESIARDWLHTTKPTLLKYFKQELRHGKERVVGQLKALVLQSALRGSTRDAKWLLDRIGDLPPPKYRDESWPSGATQIIIKGGLPPQIITPDGTPVEAAQAEDAEEE